MIKIILDAIQENYAKMEPSDDVSKICNEFDIDDSYIDWNKFSEHVSNIPLNTWMCTDTIVGLWAIFLDNEFVALKWQSARKSRERIFWESEELALKTKKFLDSIHNQTYNIDLIQDVNDTDQEIENKFIELMNYNRE